METPNKKGKVTHVVSPEELTQDMATKSKLPFYILKYACCSFLNTFSNVVGPTEIKNPPINISLDARIAARNVAEAKVASRKVGASNKPHLAPKVSEQDKAKATPVHGSKRVARTLLEIPQRRRNLILLRQ